MTTQRIYPGAVIDPAIAANMLKLRTAVNRMQNPRAGTALTSWVANAGTGGTGSLARVASGGPVDAPTYGRLTLTAAPGSGSMYIRAGALATSPVAASTSYRLRLRVRSSKISKAYITLGYYNSSSVFISSTTSSKTSLAANTWTDLPDMVVTTPALTAYLQPQAVFDVSDWPGIAPADTFDVTAICIFAASELPNGLIPIYGDGDLAGWTWAGTTHASTSSGPVGVS